MAEPTGAERDGGAVAVPVAAPVERPDPLGLREVEQGAEAAGDGAGAGAAGGGDGGGSASGGAGATESTPALGPGHRSVSMRDRLPHKVGNTIQLFALADPAKVRMFPGKCLVGPDWPCMSYTYTLIIVPNVLSLMFV